MLITLRNSGAENIHFTPKLEPNLHYKIINEASDSDQHIIDTFLKGDELDSFILDKDVLDIENLHLSVIDNSWGSTPMKSYRIKILTNNGEYRLLYPTNGGKPDFFKRIFKYLYPEMAEKQVEELV